MSENKSKYVKLAEVKEGHPNDDGSKSFYIKFEEDVSFSKGDTLSLSDPRKKFDRFAELDYITQEEAEERKAKVPDFIKFEIMKKRS